MGFNSGFKGLNQNPRKIHTIQTIVQIGLYNFEAHADVCKVDSEVSHSCQLIASSVPPKNSV